MNPFRSPLKNQQRHKGPTTAQCHEPSVLGNRFCLECSAELITLIFYTSKCCTINQKVYH